MAEKIDLPVLLVGLGPRYLRRKDGPPPEKGGSFRLISFLSLQLLARPFKGD